MNSKIFLVQLSAGYYDDPKPLWYDFIRFNPPFAEVKEVEWRGGIFQNK